MTENKLKEMGLILPEPFKTPANTILPFSWVQISKERAYVSDHLPITSDGTLAMPIGKLGDNITIEQGYELAKLTA